MSGGTRADHTWREQLAGVVVRGAVAVLLVVAIVVATKPIAGAWRYYVAGAWLAGFAVGELLAAIRFARRRRIAIADTERLVRRYRENAAGAAVQYAAGVDRARRDASTIAREWAERRAADVGPTLTDKPPSRKPH